MRDGCRRDVDVLGGAEKYAASFSPRKHPQRSPEATPPVLSSAAALLDELFEHPATTAKKLRIEHAFQLSSCLKVAPDESCTFSRAWWTGQLSYEDLPTPTASEVLVQVKACALNHLDISVRRKVIGLSHAAPGMSQGRMWPGSWRKWVLSRRRGHCRAEGFSFTGVSCWRCDASLTRRTTSAAPMESSAP